jgi:hemerythrin-like domain-containing protein
MEEVGEPMEEMIKCHEEILGHLDRLEQALGKFRKDGNGEDLRLTLEVFLLFLKTTLRLHRKDEEEALFPCLRETDFPGGEIERLIEDHDKLRATEDFIHLIKDIKKEDTGEIDKRLGESIRNLRDHIGREEEVLFRIAREKLSDGQMSGIAERMRSFRRGGGVTS